jgi:hypothetical protein
VAERIHRNIHLIEMDGCMWRCIHCGHVFDALSDADAFVCGDECACHSRQEMVSRG